MIEARFRKKLPGLRLDIDLVAPLSGITALFGRSGAGKTSILMALAGGLRPDSGLIRVGERVFFDSTTSVDLPVHQRRIGYVFQDSRLFPHLSVGQNLRYGLHRAKAPPQLDVEGVMALLGIEHLLQRRPHKLSGGERQRVAIGRALLSQPDLLLLDEPMSSLDPPRKAELLPYIERLRDDLDLPILYISHAFDEVARLADRLVLVDGGQVLRSGTLHEVAADPLSAPLIGRFEAGAVLDCTVAEHDPAADLSTLAFTGGLLRVPRIELALGARARVRIRSRDVAISLSRPMDISITNGLPGTLVSLTRRDGPYVDAAIDVGGAIVRALITRESSQRLGLRPGLEVWALIKTVAFDGRSLGFTRRDRPTSASR